MLLNVHDSGFLPELEEKIDLAPRSEEGDLTPIAPVLESQTLERCETLKKLLVYLWLHRGQEFNEYSIATEALGRRADFDARFDASVRVQISRLRQKLNEFYDQEGSHCQIVLRIPTGSHFLEIEQREIESLGTGEDSQLVNIGHEFPWRRVSQLLAGFCLVSLLLSSWLWWKLRQTEGFSGGQDAEVREFWHEFLGGEDRTLIVLPTPVFFVYKGSSKIHVRNVDINDFPAWSESPDLVTLSQKYGEPQLDQSYTVTSDTFAAIALARYLDSAGMGKSVTFVDATGSPMDALEHSNEVVFGTHFTLSPFQSILNTMTFSMGIGEEFVLNGRPSPGEPALFRRLDENARRALEPSIIAFLPGKTTHTHLLILQGRHTSALIRFLTSSAGIASLNKIWRAHGSPRYYEAVVNVEVDGTDLISCQPVALHSYAYRPPNTP